ncbi:hypothetical protein Bbelb_148260 [Branchiostoma belcheri]|nr:hypothetical protein Bbelb_148260 [Branchiostoma belcheri]
MAQEAAETVRTESVAFMGDLPAGAPLREPAAEYFFKKDRQCNVKVERLQPKVQNPGGPCSTVHTVRCGQQISLDSIRVVASEKLGFEVVDVLDWESRGPLDETITIMEDTKMWVTDAPVKRAQFSDMHDDL